MRRMNSEWRRDRVVMIGREYKEEVIRGSEICLCQNNNNNNFNKDLVVWGEVEQKVSGSKG